VVRAFGVVLDAVVVVSVVRAFGVVLDAVVVVSVVRAFGVVLDAVVVVFTTASVPQSGCQSRRDGNRKGNA
jgi:hypothetical protein